MKKLCYLLILLISINSFSQSELKHSTEHHSETYPIYKGCEKAKDAKKCFYKKINSHFSQKFNISKFSYLHPGVKRAFIIFRVNELGEIDSIKIKAPHINIKKEARRVLHLVPKIIPGTLNNQPMPVKFSIPIAFRIQRKSQAIPRKTPWNKNNGRRF